MALEDNGIVPTMPLAPSNGGGFGFGGDNGWWILLLLLFAGGGWGNGFGGGFGNNQLSYDFPWLLNGQNGINANTNSGFRDAMINDGIGNIQNSITSGFGDVQTALCGGFAGVNAAINGSAAGITASITGAQNSLAQQMYANQISDLERSFAAQTANTAGLTNLSSQLSNCCCANKEIGIQTQNVVQSEGAATRLAIQNQTQAILDRLCQQEIDSLKAQNVALQNQVNMQNLAASQATQTAQLIADNTAQTQYLVNRIAPYPSPAYVVNSPYSTPTTATA